MYILVSGVVQWSFLGSMWLLNRPLTIEILVENLLRSFQWCFVILEVGSLTLTILINGTLFTLGHASIMAHSVVSLVSFLSVIVARWWLTMASDFLVTCIYALYFGHRCGPINGYRFVFGSVVIWIRIEAASFTWRLIPFQGR